MNNPLRYVDPTGEDWTNPLSWGADISAGLSAAGAAVGNWWSSSSVWDKLDLAMTVIGFIPGVDVISDAYFLGRAVLDVIEGKGDWTAVVMAAAGLAPPVGIGALKFFKTFKKAAGSVTDAGKLSPRVAGAAEGAQDAARASDVGDGGTFYRYMSKAEMENTRGANTLRPGKDPPHFFTTDVYNNADEAMNKLSLYKTPEVR